MRARPAPNRSNSARALLCGSPALTKLAPGVTVARSGAPLGLPGPRPWSRSAPYTPKNAYFGGHAALGPIPLPPGMTTSTSGTPILVQRCCCWWYLRCLSAWGAPVHSGCHAAPRHGQIRSGCPSPKPKPIITHHTPLLPLSLHCIVLPKPPNTHRILSAPDRAARTTTPVDLCPGRRTPPSPGQKQDPTPPLTTRW